MGVEARSLDQIRIEAEARERCWRDAYSTQLAAHALEVGSWSATAQSASPIRNDEQNEPSVDLVEKQLRELALASMTTSHDR